MTDRDKNEMIIGQTAWVFLVATLSKKKILTGNLISVMCVPCEDPQATSPQYVLVEGAHWGQVRQRLTFELCKQLGQRRDPAGVDEWWLMSTCHRYW